MPSRVILLIVCFFAEGCLMAGNYHSAHTLAPGESSMGTTFSFTTYEYQGDSFSFPNLIPELTYHIGMTDDLELGGRVALGSLALEADAKYRFLKSDRLHIAGAPALAYQALGSVSGTTLRLPGIVTYEVSDRLAINLALFGSTSYYNSTDDDYSAFDGTLGAVGFSAGVELRGETLALLPSVEWTDYVIDFDDDSDSFSTVSINLHVSRISGREKKQLDRIEKKIDALGGGTY